MKVDLSERTPVPDYDVDFQLTDANLLDRGVELFARAWSKDGTPIGFGRDGSVEVERFRIINPPILVLDPKGPIVRESYDPEFGTKYKMGVTQSK